MPAAPHPLVLFDRAQTSGGQVLLAGVDEAGRGAWAGPVVAAAVILPVGWCPAGLNDSKQVAARRRETLCEEIMASALCWGACAVSADVIDRINILQATLRAMAGAVARLDPAPDLVLIDGLQAPSLPMPSRTLIKGDARSAAVAAASVLAKVLRDRVMRAYHRRYPDYGFDGHVGYGAPAHRRALAALGPCPWHRLSYRPVASGRQGRLF